MSEFAKTLLCIDSSARRAGSHSRELADEFANRWRDAHAAGRMIRRDLTLEVVPHLDDSTIRAFYTADADVRSRPTQGLERSDEWIAEIEAADDLLISLPVYNFSVPSTLKAYFDHVVRVGRTFDATDSGFVGRLEGKRAYVAIACGGTPENSGSDAVVALVETTLRFMGISAIETVVWSGTTLGPAELERGRAHVMRRVAELFSGQPEPRWIGEFTADDRLAITALRDGQARAIVHGDADAYAALCADDVSLLLPGSPPIVGRDAVREFEMRIFSGTRFRRFVKRPQRVERGGNLVFEIGAQEVEVVSGSATGLRSPRQKYLHVFRRTSGGWRIAALISNADESVS